MRTVVSGGSGFIGTVLCQSLVQAGHEVVRLVRRMPGPGELAWDPLAGTIDAKALRGSDAVLCLSGAGIGDKRWNAARRAEILASRVRSVSVLAEAVARVDERPAVFLQASAIGYYGDRGDEILTEQSQWGAGFLPEVCRRWEAAAGALSGTGVRHVALRSGIVLSPGGGALAKQLPLFRSGLGGRLGSGKQWMSWIALDDHVRAIVHVLESDTVSGPVNLVAPGAVTNKRFTSALASALHRPAVMAAPAFALRSALGRGMADELLLCSQRVEPAVLNDSGFDFGHPELDEALEALLG